MPTGTSLLPDTCYMVHAMNTPVFALIDCNNFFVSCERIFRPDLEGRPVIVLSSNDGCAVARSNEAKVLGIPMAAPAFKYRDVIKRHNIITFSANFELYGDISKRIVDLLTTITPKIEVYSVDESFLELSNFPISDFKAWGKMVRELIWHWVGVPVSIGIAPSKALAKLASDRAKKAAELNNVCSFVGTNAEDPAHHMDQMEVGDIWGIGRRLSPKEPQAHPEHYGHSGKAADCRAKRRFLLAARANWQATKKYYEYPYIWRRYL